MATNQLIRRSRENRIPRNFEGIVSSALIDRLSARIARREGRMKYRGADRWARQDGEAQLPPAA